MTKTLLAVALLATVAALPARAQQPRPTELSASQSLNSTQTGIPPYNPSQGGTSAVQNGPTARLFGIPIQVSAPVIPPYNHSSMQTLAGQPMLGRDAVIAQGMGGGLTGE